MSGRQARRSSRAARPPAEPRDRNAAPPSPVTPLPARFHLALTLALCLFGVIAWAHVPGLPFVNDDYVFIDKARRTGFWRMWLPVDLPFAWYRPFSREFHYWLLERLFGSAPGPAHAVSFALWLLAMNLYARLAAVLTGPRAAAISTAAVAALALWGVPVSWVAGAQDLWMLVFGLTFLLLLIAGRTALAPAALLLALASKETALLLIPIGIAALAMRGAPARLIGARIAAPAVIATGWMLVHPWFRARLSGAVAEAAPLERPPVTDAALRTLLAPFNLDVRLAPEIGWALTALLGAAGALALGAIVVLGFRTERSPSPGRRLAIGTAAWTAMGWIPLALPALGWHAYYGVLGTLGLWIGLGAALARHRTAAIAVVAALAIARQAAASSASWDWGTEWYLRRAGAFLDGLRAQLFAMHPDLPPRTRLFFARLPNSIGMIQGDGPAIRVWYSDTTLRAHFYSAYRARAAGDSALDLFFRFDSTRGLLPVRTGPAFTPAEIAEHPGWARDHEVLAARFLEAGETGRAVVEYAKLSDAFPEDVSYALFAGVLLETLNRTAEARRFYDRASPHLGGPDSTRAAAALIRADFEASRTGR